MIHFFSNPSLAWWLLLLATIGETLWFIALKKWGGFELWPWNLIQYILVFINISLLSFVLKSLPAGTVYAFWTGASAIAIAILGMWFFGDPISIGRIVFIAVTVIGIVGLQLTS